jgi:hypothetical protein
LLLQSESILIFKDLMQSTVGPVKFVQLSFNQHGKSTGVATVVFKNRGDGNKAHTSCEYPNEVEADAQTIIE